jgi:hypothetical protein
MRRVALFAVVVLAGGALAACGDDDDALSKSEFLRKGNAVCKTFGDRIEAAGDETFADLQEGEQPSADDIRSFFQDAVRPNVESLINGLDDLEPPDELRADVDDLIAEARKALDDLEDAVEDDPEKAFSDESGDPFVKVNEKSADLGLTTCAEE